MKMDQIGLCQTWHVPGYEGSLRSVLSHCALQLNELKRERGTVDGVGSWGGGGTALMLGKQQPDSNCKYRLKVMWAQLDFLSQNRK